MKLVIICILFLLFVEFASSTGAFANILRGFGKAGRFVQRNPAKTAFAGSSVAGGTGLLIGGILDGINGMLEERRSAG